MAISGTYTWNATRDDIIKRALRIVKALDQRGTPTDNQLTNCSGILNSIVKGWKNQGVCLWTVEETTLALVTATIVIGTDALYYECVRNHTSATVSKPITGADWSTYWIETSTTTGAVAWSAAQSYVSSNNYALAAEIIGIEEETIFVRRDKFDTKITLIGRDSYMGLGNKYQKGIPTHAWFERQTTPQLTFYPVPDTLTDVIHFSAIKKGMDISTTVPDTTANVDIPEEWVEALVYALASRIAPENDVASNERAFLRNEAVEFFSIAMRNDTEKTGIQISPDLT